MTSDPLRQVIANDLCIGCGACAFADSARVAVGLSAEGQYRAKLSGAKPGGADAPSCPPVCPISGDGADETALAAGLYPDLPADPRIGRYKATLAGHVAEGAYRDRGGSGGMVTWLAAQALRRGLVDRVLHVKETPGAEALFGYAFSDSPEAVAAGAKSRYAPITLAEVLPELAGSDQRTLVIGLPCFIKSIRLMQTAGLLSHAQVPHTIGLVCGHLKSRFFGEYLAWQAGVAPERIGTLDFRHKLPGQDASRYAVSVTPKGGQPVVAPMAGLHGRDWGEGLFKPLACEFCDDVLAECADVAVGDAWLPGYVDEYRGANIVVTRQGALDEIVAEGRASGALQMDDVSVAAVAQSQASGLRHRREGLSHRLARRGARGQWVPVKRVPPGLAPGLRRRLVYDLRLRIAARSSALWAQSGDPARFRRRIWPLVTAYRLMGRAPSVIRGVLRQVVRMGRRRG